MASNRLEILLTANVKPLNDALGQAQKNTGKVMGEIVKQAQGATVALGALAAGGAVVGKGLLDAASEVQQFQATLTAVLGSADAAKAKLAEFSEAAKNMPFDLPGITAAGIKLTTFKLDTQKFLPIVGNLAAVMGRDISEAALIFGKAMQGNSEGLQSLFDSGMVTKQMLIDNGAILKSTGAFANEAGAGLEELQAALEKVVQTKYGTVMEQQNKTLKGAFSALSDSVGQLKATLGAELAPAAETVARSLTKVVEAAKEMPDWMKSTIAYGVAVTAGLAAMAAAFTGTAAVLGPVIAQVAGLATKFPMLTAAMGPAGVAGIALSAAFVGVTTAVIALGAAGATYITILENTTKAEQALLDIELKRAKGFREHNQFVGKSTEELKKMGATAKDITDVINGLQDAQTEARKQGTKEGDAKAAEYAKEVSRLLAIRAEFAATEETKRVEVKKTEVAQKAADAKATAAAEDYKNKASNSYWESSREQLKALDEVLKKLPHTNKLYGELSMDRVKLARDASKEEKDANDKARKEDLDAAKHHVDLLGGETSRHTANQIAALKHILASKKLSKDEERQLETELHNLQQEFTRRSASEHTKAEADKKKKTEEALKAKRDALDATTKLHEEELKGTNEAVNALKERLKNGEDVLDQLEQMIQKQNEQRQALSKEKGDKEALGKSGADAEKLRSAAKLEADNEAKASERELESLRKEAAKQKAADHAADLSLAEKEARYKENLLQDQLKAGKNVSSDLLKAIKARQQVEMEQIKAKAAAESAGASPADQARLQKQLEVDILDLKRQQTNELKASNEQIKAAEEAQKRMRNQGRGGIMSLDEFVKSTNDSFAAQATFASAGPSGAGVGAALSSLANSPITTQMNAAAGGTGSGAKTGSAAGSGGSGSRIEALLSEVVKVLTAILGALSGKAGSGPKSLGTEHTDWRHKPNRPPGL